MAAIGRAVEKSPLALCDARTLADKDLVAADLIYRDRIGETFALRHDPAQHWYYFPRLSPDEAILIKGYESDPRAARCAPHSAFDDPTSRPDAPERESIETRALVIHAARPPRRIPLGARPTSSTLAQIKPLHANTD